MCCTEFNLPSPDVQPRGLVVKPLVASITKVYLQVDWCSRLSCHCCRSLRGGEPKRHSDDEFLEDGHLRQIDRDSKEIGEQSVRVEYPADILYTDEGN